MNAIRSRGKNGKSKYRGATCKNVVQEIHTWPNPQIRYVVYMGM